MIKYALKNINLYESKSNESKILTAIPMGSKINVLDMEEEWDKASFNSITGYVESTWLSKTKYAWTNANLREKGSISSDKIMVVPKGAAVEVLDENGDFDRVYYDDKEGYIYNYYLSFDGKSKNELDYSNFYSDVARFANENNVKSSSSYLLITDLKDRLIFVLKKNNNLWEQLYKWSCTIGKSSTPTIVGTFFVSGRKIGFGTNIYSVKYATRIKGGYYYHSILYDSKGNYVIDGRLGMALSHGCVRLVANNAKWIYDNIPDETKIIIH